MGSFRKNQRKTGNNWIDVNNLVSSTQNENKSPKTSYQSLMISADFKKKLWQNKKQNRVIN